MRKSAWVAASLVASALAVGGPFAGCASSSGPGSAAHPDASTGPAVCGDGVVETGEQCDNGAANAPGSGCEPDCTYTCIPDTLNGNAVCQLEKDPCSGIWTCGPNHTCLQGMPLADGMSCGTGAVCRAQKCMQSTCGDGVVEAPEECDLGAKNGTGMGCDQNCKFDCVSTDSTRNCASTDPCIQKGTCDDTKHACTPGMPQPDGTSCGGSQLCQAGHCVSPKCGDGVVEAPEQCDFGSGNGLGTGCEANCTFSCTTAPDSCITLDPCGGTYKCTAFTMATSPGQKCLAGTAPSDGSGCSIGVASNSGTCRNHLCVTPNCGNGKVDPGEQCDWGTPPDGGVSGNVSGKGCEPDCTFSCSTMNNAPNLCSGADVCSANPMTCQMQTGPTGNPGQRCVAGTVLAACAMCGGSNICVSNVCKANTCGDGCVVAPEQCDPPNGTTCDSNCRSIVCGDGVRSGPEECDDGNTKNLDGCDSNCRFEQIQRATSLRFIGSTDSFCTANALGAQALTTATLGVLQGGTNTDVTAGITNVIFKLSGPNGQADLSGASGPVIVGSLWATVQYPEGGAVNGNADVDWWYTVDPTSIDAQRISLTSLSGAYMNKTLNAGPGRFTITLRVGGSPAKFDMWNAKLQIGIGATSAPKASSGGPPGHLASENLSPTLTSFETAGVGSSGPTGELCGNIPAASLAVVNVPKDIAAGGKSACDETYMQGTNSLLDTLITGCSITGIGVVNVTQADQQDPSITFPAGTKPPYKLSASGSNHVVDTCVDGSSPAKSVPLMTCLSGLAYSSFFKLQTDRVIVK